MTIAAVEAIPLAVRFCDWYGGAENVPEAVARPAAHFQSLPRSGQFSTLVKITDIAGRTGWGEAWGLPVARAAASIVDEVFAPYLIGRNALDIGSHHQRLLDYGRRMGHSASFWVEALSGVDIALWDLRGKAANRSCADLLGERRRSAVKCYASPVPFCATPAESVARTREFLARGFRALKVKSGRGIETDRRHLEAIREAVGPDIALMVDVNGGYDVPTARGFLKTLEPLRVAWLEEPVPCGDLAGLRALRNESGIAIAAGENLSAIDDFRRMFDAGAVDVINPNVTRCGGFTSLRSLAAEAESAGVRVSLHGVGSVLTQAASVAFMSTLTADERFEFNLFPNPLRDELAGAPLACCGEVDVPRGPGLGVVPSERSIARFRDSNSCSWPIAR